jgi:hypothetical protein
LREIHSAVLSTPSEEEQTSETRAISQSVSGSLLSLRTQLRELEEEDHRRAARIEALEAALSSVVLITTGEPAPQGKCDTAETVETVSGAVKALQSRLAELQEESTQRGERILELKTALDSVYQNMVDLEIPEIPSKVGQEIIDRYNSLRGNLEESNSERETRGTRIASLEQILRKLYDFVVEKASDESLNFETVEESVSLSVSSLRKRVAEVESSLQSIRSLFIENEVAHLDCSEVVETVSNAVAAVRNRLAEVEEESRQRSELIGELKVVLNSIHLCAVGESQGEFELSAIQKSVSSAFEFLRSENDRQKSQITDLRAGFADLSSHVLSSEAVDALEIVSGIKSAVDSLRLFMTESRAVNETQTRKISELESALAEIEVAVVGTSNPNGTPLELVQSVKSTVEGVHSSLTESAAVNETQTKNDFGT